MALRRHSKPRGDAMAKDGPPASGGFRYGARAAMAAQLPARSVRLRGVPTKENLQARQSLVDFAAYPSRAKSIGKALPVAKSVSPERAAALQRIEDFASDEYREVILWENESFRIILRSKHKEHCFIQESSKHRFISKSYRTREEAMLKYHLKQISWRIQEPRDP
jgi:hypothetical protein